MKDHIGALILMAAVVGCTEAATIPGDRQFRATWGGDSADPGLAPGNLNSQLSEVLLGVQTNSDVVEGLCFEKAPGQGVQCTRDATCWGCNFSGCNTQESVCLGSKSAARRKRSGCPGPNCPEERSGCPGPNCPQERTGCPGPNCSHGRSGCPGPNCPSDERVGCAGPDCP